MLIKLLKYDLKWIYKRLVVFYIVAIFFSIAQKIASSFEDSFLFLIIARILSGAQFAILASVLINNMIRLWSRFINNIYKDESYLTHTLPISKRKIFLSKIISSIITMITSIIVIVACIIISYYSKENWNLLSSNINKVSEQINIDSINFVIIVSLIFLFELLFITLSGYVGIQLGFKSNNTKSEKSIIYGFIAYMIPVLLILIIIYIIGLFNKDIMNIFINNSNIAGDTIKILLNTGLFLYIIYNLCYYFLGQKIFNKGVNVE